jgi:uncharacterized phage protein (TIGR01671 family)
MREIKFRAWHILDKEIVYFEDWESIRNLARYAEYNYVDNITQYTGLKDKEGKEIYEGDIVKGTFSIRTGTRSVGRGRNAHTIAVYEDIEVVGIVSFKEELSAFYFETDFKREYLTSFWRGCGRTKLERDANYLTTTYDSPKDLLHKVVLKIQVIGNVYENPELLNR